MKYQLQTYWEVLFDDNTIDFIEFRKCYNFHGQKSAYLLSWLTKLIKDKNITAKPLTITEKYRVIECEPYDIIFGV